MSKDTFDSPAAQLVDKQLRYDPTASSKSMSVLPPSIIPIEIFLLLLCCCCYCCCRCCCLLWFLLLTTRGVWGCHLVHLKHISMVCLTSRWNTLVKGERPPPSAPRKQRKKRGETHTPVKIKVQVPQTNSPNSMVVGLNIGEESLGPSQSTLSKLQVQFKENYCTRHNREKP